MKPPFLKVYAADTTPLYDERLFSGLYSRVSADRKEKTDRMRFQKDKCLSLGVEFLLMCACMDCGIDYYSESRYTGSASKPGFKNDPVYFNLSHSGKRALCVISDVPCGCDAEEIRPIDLKITERFFTTDEHRAVMSAGSREKSEDLLYRIWTLKESFMKCTGRGLGIPPASFGIEIKNEHILLKQNMFIHDYSLYDENAYDGYRYAWCVQDPDSGTSGRTASIIWKIPGEDLY